MSINPLSEVTLNFLKFYIGAPSPQSQLEFKRHLAPLRQHIFANKIPWQDLINPHFRASMDRMTLVKSDFFHFTQVKIISEKTRSIFWIDAIFWSHISGFVKENLLASYDKMIESGKFFDFSLTVDPLCYKMIKELNHYFWGQTYNFKNFSCSEYYERFGDLFVQLKMIPQIFSVFFPFQYGGIDHQKRVLRLPVSGEVPKLSFQAFREWGIDSILIDESHFLMDKSLFARVKELALEYKLGLRIEWNQFSNKFLEHLDQLQGLKLRKLKIRISTYSFKVFNQILNTFNQIRSLQLCFVDEVNESLWSRIESQCSHKIKKLKLTFPVSVARDSSFSRLKNIAGLESLAIDNGHLWEKSSGIPYRTLKIYQYNQLPNIKTLERFFLANQVSKLKFYFEKHSLDFKTDIQRQYFFALETAFNFTIKHRQDLTILTVYPKKREETQSKFFGNRIEFLDHLCSIFEHGAEKTEVEKQEELKFIERIFDSLIREAVQRSSLKPIVSLINRYRTIFAEFALAEIRTHDLQKSVTIIKALWNSKSSFQLGKIVQLDREIPFQGLLWINLALIKNHLRTNIKEPDLRVEVDQALFLFGFTQNAFD